MEGTPSRKTRWARKVTNLLFSRKSLKVIFWVVLLFVAIFIINQTILPRIGYKFRVDFGGLKLEEYTYYSKNESRILNILVNDTPVLRSIPQSEYIRSETGLDAEEYEKNIRLLAEKGDIVLDENGDIIRAYPWAADTGAVSYIYLKANEDSTIGPLTVSGALYAMSVAPLLGVDVNIVARFKDSGEPLAIDIENNQITFTSDITAVVYRAEKIENSIFYSSPEEAESDYPGQYGLNKVVRLDRALVIGIVIAREIKDKINR